MQQSNSQPQSVELIATREQFETQLQSTLSTRAIGIDPRRLLADTKDIDWYSLPHRGGYNAVSMISISGTSSNSLFFFITG